MTWLLKVPQLLQGGYGVLIRLALVALVGAGLWLWGATWGWQHEKAKLEVLGAELKTLGEQAFAHNKELKAQGEHNAKEVATDYEDQLDFISHWHDTHPRLVLRDNPCRSAAAAQAPGAGSADVTAREPVAARPDSGGAGEGEEGSIEVTVDFVTACAIDAAHVNAFRHYVIVNELPVE